MVSFTALHQSQRSKYSWNYIYKEKFVTFVHELITEELHKRII